MQPWEDDQALFFKLAHINEPAGFFGPGPFGSGIYRFGATPFIPIYHLFRFNTIAYFGFLIILYIITTIIVYKTFTLILGNKGGKIAGFLYASGYITSESFIRMANSATTSISIILCSLVLMSYWKFFKNGRYLWYLTALLFYFVAVQLTLVRVHYFIAVIILFELLFLASFKNIKSYFNSIVRLLPFGYIFYVNYIIGGDSRTGEVGKFLSSILHGQFYQFYGFLSSLSYLIIPDWLMGYIFSLSNFINQNVLLALTVAVVTLILLWKNSQRKILVSIYLAIFFIWIYLTNNIFKTPLLQVNDEQLFIATLGGLILIVVSVMLFKLTKHRQLFILVSSWLTINMFAYSAYFPTVIYSSVNRYLAHSFLALVGALAVLFIALPKDKLIGKIGITIIILLGVGNIYNSVIYQNNILHTRSYPSKQFYSQLKSYLPNLAKGDVLYIDVAPDAENLFTANVTAAMMPNTTSFAWRYGIDRYDFKLTNDFNELLDIITADKTPSEKIHAFAYSKNGLTDTTTEIRSFLLNNFKDNPVILDTAQSSNVILKKQPSGTEFSQPDLIINLKEPIKSMIPSQLVLSISAESLSTGMIKFPLTKQNPSNTTIDIWADLNLRLLAFDYKQSVVDFYQNTSFETSSDWKDRIVKNVSDQDPTTVWQSDRILWKDKKAFVKIDLGKPQEIAKAAWINGFVNNTPTVYTIETSLDGRNWIEVKKTNNLRRIHTTEIQTEDFSPTLARFVRMTIFDTIDGDSPSLAEVWVIPAGFKNLDIKTFEKFLSNPMAYVPTELAFEETVAVMQNTGKVKLSWETDKANGWQTTKRAEKEISYDGLVHQYNFLIPAGGVVINKIKLSDFTLPGVITINSVAVSYPSLNEYLNSRNLK